MSERAQITVQSLDLPISEACEQVSHNLNGQRLGRKGRETRERIIHAAIDVLETAGDEPFTLSAVARRAGLGMSSLYNYFTDLSELMEAVLEPVMASARDAYLALLEGYWLTAELLESCERFWARYAEFWERNATVLHQRNRMSDAGDDRMLQCRVDAGQPLARSLSLQLGSGDGSTPVPQELAMASVLATMLERTVTVQTHPSYRRVLGQTAPNVGAQGSRLLALALFDARQARDREAGMMLAVRQ